MQEEWRDVTGFEGYYQVNRAGEIRSVDRVIFSARRNTHITRKGGPRAAVQTDKGYLHLTLHKAGKRHTRLVHRLVAEAFIPNPQGLPEVDHADNNPANPHADNLSWGRRSETRR